MFSLPHLPHDVILLILAHTPLDAISISQVCRDLYALGELASYWLTALKASRAADIPLICTANLDLNAFLKDPKALKHIAFRTFIRERNWTSPNPKLIGLASRVQMSDDFTILYIIPGTPLVLIRFYEGPYRTFRGRMWCYNSKTGKSLCQIQPISDVSVNHQLLATLPEQGRCLLVVEDTFAPLERPLIDDLMVVNLTYSPDYQTASMTVTHSFLLRRCPSHSVRQFCLSPQLCIYSTESKADNWLNIVALNLLTGAQKVFHTDIHVVQDDYDNILLQRVADAFYMLFNQPETGLQYALRYSVDTLLNADSLPPDTPIPVRRDVPASEYGQTIFYKSYGGRSLRRYCFPSDHHNAILVDIQNFKLHPYARRWSSVPSQSAQFVVSSTQDSAENPILTLLHSRDHFGLKGSGGQLMLPPELDIVKVMSFMLDECNASLLVRDDQNQLWTLCYA